MGLTHSWNYKELHIFDPRNGHLFWATVLLILFMAENLAVIHIVRDNSINLATFEGIGVFLTYVLVNAIVAIVLTGIIHLSVSLSMALPTILFWTNSTKLNSIKEFLVSKVSNGHPRIVHLEKDETHESTFYIEIMSARKFGAVRLHATDLGYTDDLENFSFTTNVIRTDQTCNLCSTKAETDYRIPLANGIDSLQEREDSDTRTNGAYNNACPACINKLLERTIDSMDNELKQKLVAMNV